MSEARASEQGVLYVVATPIGNLGDITLRAIDILRSASIIAAEDTRHTKKLLAHLGISQKLVEALHAHSSERDLDRMVTRLASGESVALVSDAGTPVVSDPGDGLVRRAMASGIRVVPVPGPSAALAALVASGLASGGFRFFGFLPREGGARHRAIADVCATPETVILFESPERAHATLTELAQATPMRSGCIARELTKLHEEFVRGTLLELAEARDSWRGEIVLVLGAYIPEQRETEVTSDALDERILRELEAGLHSKTIAERLAAWSGRPKRDIYERVVELKRLKSG